MHAKIAPSGPWSNFTFDELVEYFTTQHPPQFSAHSGNYRRGAAGSHNLCKLGSIGHAAWLAGVRHGKQHPQPGRSVTRIVSDPAQQHLAELPTFFKFVEQVGDFYRVERDGAVYVLPKRYFHEGLN